ncbi:MAG: Flp family type IVb pilin [Pseudomonadota bacterium]
MTKTDLTRRAFLFGRDATEITEDETGATALEYGLIAALVATVLVSSISLLGRRNRQNLRCVIRAMRGRDPNRFCQRRGVS